MSTSQPSPLAEASPESLDRLFSMDPLELAEGDIDKIVARFRREREGWDKAEAAGALKAPRGTKAAPKAKAPAPEGLSLDDLGL